MLNIYLAFQRACQMFHAGAAEEAIGVLQRLIAAVEDFNAEITDTDMDYDIALMEQLIEVMEANGGTQPDEPVIPENP